MPRLTQWFVRASLVYLGLGFTIGTLLLWNKGLPFAPGVPRLLPTHVEFLLVGWVIQLVMGVATWIFPRVGLRASPYGSVAAGWAAFLLLNVGVWLVGPGGVVFGAVVPLVGRLFEAAAAAVFAANIWARVRASGLSQM